MRLTFQSFVWNDGIIAADTKYHCQRFARNPRTGIGASNGDVTYEFFDRVGPENDLEICIPVMSSSMQS